MRGDAPRVGRESAYRAMRRRRLTVIDVDRGLLATVAPFSRLLEAMAPGKRQRFPVGYATPPRVDPASTYRATIGVASRSLTLTAVCSLAADPAAVPSVVTPRGGGSGCARGAPGPSVRKQSSQRFRTGVHRKLQDHVVQVAHGSSRCRFAPAMTVQSSGRGRRGDGCGLAGRPPRLARKPYRPRYSSRGRWRLAKAIWLRPRRVCRGPRYGREP